MSTPVDLYNAQRLLPGPTEGENGWAAELTEFLVQVALGLESTTMKVGSIIFPYNLAATTTLSAGGTLTVTNPCHKISGSGGAVTIAGVSSGSRDGQFLLLVGNHATNMVTILDGAGSNVQLETASITLGVGQALLLRWDATLGDWIEVTRSARGTYTNPDGVEFFEAAINGTSKVILRAPASLAADLTFTFPASIPGPGYLYSAADGALSVTAGSATLDTAYDGGRTITVDAGKVLLNGTVAQTEETLNVVAAAAYPAIKTTGGTFGLDSDRSIVIGNNYALQCRSAAGVARDAVKRDASNNLIIGDVGSEYLKLQTGANDITFHTNGVERFKIGSGGQIFGFFGSAGHSVTLDKTSTGTGIVLRILNAGIQEGLKIEQTGAAAAVTFTQSSNNTVLFLTKTSTGAGPVLDIDNSGTGYAIDISQTGAGTALKISTSGGAAIIMNGLAIQTGAGTPEGTITAPVGSLYLRTDGGAATTLYVKESGVGNTGWAAK